MQFDQNIVDEIKKQFPEKPNGMKMKFWLEKNPHIKEYLYGLIDQYESFTCIGNVLYCLYANIDVDTLKCKQCGKTIKMTVNNVIREFCGCKCAANNERKKQHAKKTIQADPTFYQRRQQKIIDTNMERYGAKAPAMNSAVVEKMKATWESIPTLFEERNKKLKATVLEKYGVENVSQLENIKQQKRDTAMKNYGVDHPMHSEDVKNHLKQTCLEKYGVDNCFKSEKCRQAVLEKSWRKICSWKDYVVPTFTREEYVGYSKGELEWRCVKCGAVFKQKVYSTKFASNVDDLIPRCFQCYPAHSSVSAEETELYNYCKSIYNGTIIRNDRTIVNPSELDIVIPDKHLAIEFDGMYWHSDASEHVTKDYHLRKTEKCEDKGYHLLHVFELDWILHSNQIKSKIKALLNVNQQSIYARKCTIQEIDNKQKNDFLNQNHIQGEDKSSVKLGLYFGDLLVAVMTFGVPRFNKKYQYELIRYATLDGYRVIGGAGKLLTYFERTYNPLSIITYADKRYSQGNMYFKLGFTFVENSEPSYYWIKDHHILSRYQCQKSKLNMILGDKFNPNLSETENMKLNGWNKIYDCGNMVFEKKVNKK